jgi:hypothetical protein
MFKPMQSVSSANFSTNAKHEHLPIISAMTSFLELGSVQEARLTSKRINLVKKWSGKEMALLPLPPLRT